MNCKKAKKKKYRIRNGVNAYIGSRTDVERAIDGLTEASRINKVTIIKSSFSKMVEDDSLVHQPVSLTLLGSFGAIGRYIESLENLPAPLVMHRINLTPEPNDSTNVVAKLQGEFYGHR